jgi:hypothetical protein
LNTSWKLAGWLNSYYLPTARTIYDSVGADAEKNIIDRIINFLKTKGGKVPKRVYISPCED